jgi:hypothetical protein
MANKALLRKAGRSFPEVPMMTPPAILPVPRAGRVESSIDLQFRRHDFSFSMEFISLADLMVRKMA